MNDIYYLNKLLQLAKRYNLSVEDLLYYLEVCDWNIDCCYYYIAPFEDIKEAENELYH